MGGWKLLIGQGDERLKKLYLVGGPMGVGKTTVCQLLKKRLDHSVFFDGDWCWDSNPFIVTEETRTMVLNNIVYLLNSFLSCSIYQHVIFCWVMHDQSVIDSILQRLSRDDCLTYAVSLLCGEKELKGRLMKDVKSGLREENVIARSLERLPLYEKLDTYKIDTSFLTEEQTAECILRLAGNWDQGLL